MLSAAAISVCLLAAFASAQTAPPRPPLPDKEWKRWLDEVRPLLVKADTDEIRVLAPSQRRQFREDFWLARDPDPGTPDNEVRTEYERRVVTAEKRFRSRRQDGLERLRPDVRPAWQARLDAKRPRRPALRHARPAAVVHRTGRRRHRALAVPEPPAPARLSGRLCVPLQPGVRSGRQPLVRAPAADGRRLVRAESPLAPGGRFRNNHRPRGVISCLVPPNSVPWRWRGMMNISLKGAS